jgi:hypothetical protein
MQLLNIAAISLFSMTAMANYERGIVHVKEDVSGNMNYVCKVKNNDGGSYEVSQVIFNYTCRDSLDVNRNFKASCATDCTIRSYSIGSFEGPLACKEGSIALPTCGVVYTLN